MYANLCCHRGLRFFQLVHHRREAACKTFRDSAGSSFEQRTRKDYQFGRDDHTAEVRRYRGQPRKRDGGHRPLRPHPRPRRKRDRALGTRVVRSGLVLVDATGSGLGDGLGVLARAFAFGTGDATQKRSGLRWTRSCRLGRLFAMPANVTARRSLASALESRVHPRDDLGGGVALRVPRIMVSDE